METFSAEWLALREPADREARAESVAVRVATRMARALSVRAIDLAAGTGANVRYLLPRLPFITHWTLVDYDAELLALAQESLAPIARAADVTIETVVADIRDVARLPLEGCALVTASALLDLVSRDWVRALAARCDEVGADVHFALTFDGRIEFDPPSSLDARVRELVGLHQRTDKGFGPALGPGGTTAVERAFPDRVLITSASDWRLGHQHAELQRQLLAGWATAAEEMAPEDASAFHAWLRQRLEWVDARRSRLRVGHLDLAAWP